MPHELIDEMDEPSLRAFAHHQARTIERLHRERETHLAQVEQAFRRRHNEQVKTIAGLEKALKDRAELNTRRTA